MTTHSTFECPGLTEPIDMRAAYLACLCPSRRLPMDAPHDSTGHSGASQRSCRWSDKDGTPEYAISPGLMSLARIGQDAMLSKYVFEFLDENGNLSFLGTK